jgi:hypothetical protein
LARILLDDVEVLAEPDLQRLLQLGARIVPPGA